MKAAPSTPSSFVASANLISRIAFLANAFSLATAQSPSSIPTQTTYLRPLNADCVAQELGLVDLGSGTYFPSSYVLAPPSPTTEVINSAADGFSVEYKDSYKIVENRISNITYVLYECGTDRPSADQVPAGSVFFQVPLTSVSVAETVPYAYLEALEVVDRVTDVSAYTTSACGQKLVECGFVSPNYVDFSTFEVNETSLDLGKAKADAIILGTAGAGQPAPVLAFDAENDPGLLNRAEWIKYLGLFFNKERQAETLYNAIVDRYEEEKKLSEQADAASAGGSPVIAWVSHFTYDNEEHFDVSFAGYKQDLVEDASAKLPSESAQALVEATPGARLSAFSNETVEFAWDDPSGANGAKTFASKKEAVAAFQKLLSEVDAIVDETYAMDPATYDFQAEYGFAAPALTYRVDGKLSADNGYDWFESSFVRPDLMLRDFVRITDSVRAGKNVTPDGFEFTWLRHLDEKPVVVEAKDCARITECGQEAKPICPFVRSCGDGTTALLREDEGNAASCGEACCYESCTAVAGMTKEGAAQMAAPAVILITLLVVFVEALLQFC